MEKLTIEEAQALTATSSPSQALKEMKRRGKRRMRYLPHVGAKQKAKALKRLAGASA